MSQIADNRFPGVMLLGGLSVNLNHLKTRMLKFLSFANLLGKQQVHVTTSTEDSFLHYQSS